MSRAITKVIKKKCSMMTKASNILLKMFDDNTIRTTIDDLARHMLASMDFERKDRLWPADIMVFQTNPLNVAYGASGTALFIYDVLGELPTDIRDWFDAQPIDVNSYPPGLYSGIAGIAWSYAEMGMVDRGIDLLRLVPKSPLVREAADIFNGAAGWGFASLSFYLQTKDEQLCDLACQAGDYLLQTARQDKSGVYWHSPDDGSVRLGFALGGSGIALFLLYLWRVTTNPRYLQIACEAIEFEISHGSKKGKALLFGPTPDSNVHSPYWLRGSGGIATALLRFADLLEEKRYLELACMAAQPCMDFFSVAPHLFEGLASMGDTLIDMYLATGNRTYIDAAYQKARQTLLYRIERPQGTAFPGRLLVRISHDYGIGGAGIGIFLNRLLKPGRRRFHDIFPRRIPTNNEQ
jgi:hypothetical protein